MLTQSKISKIAKNGKDVTPDSNEPVFTTEPGIGLRIDQPLFVDGFALAEAAEDQARANLAISRSNRDKTIKDLSYNVAVAYYNLVRTQKLAQVREDAVKQAQDSLDITRQLAKLGVATEIDVKKAEVQLGAAQIGRNKRKRFSDKISFENIFW
ncbi:MAG: TolC family protein [bacterium]